MRQGLITPETRFDESTQSITGTAAVYYRSDDPGTEYTGLGFRERISPGAFAKTVAEDDIRGLFDHNPAQILGRTSARTMEVSLTKRGLTYSIPYDESDQDHRNVKKKLERGDITGSSFGFKVRDEEWSSQDGEDVRNLTDVQVAEVSIVTFPAYKSASSGMRDEDLVEIRSALDAWRLGSSVEEAEAEWQMDMEERLIKIEEWKTKSLQRQIDDLYARIQKLS